MVGTPRIPARGRRDKDFNFIPQLGSKFKANLGYLKPSREERMEKRRRKGTSYCTQEGKGRVTRDTPRQNDREAVHRPSIISRSTPLEQVPDTLEMQKHCTTKFP